MKSILLGQWKAWLFPLLLLMCPWFFLNLWVVPFGLWLPIDLGKFFLVCKQATFFCYVILLCGVALNWINAFGFFKTQNFKGMQISLLIIRIASIATYTALVWGQLLSVLYLMGPDENKHIFFLITLSFIALNVSGMFYALPLILQLKKTQKISGLAASGYIIFGFIIAADIISALILQTKCKELN